MFLGGVIYLGRKIESPVILSETGYKELKSPPDIRLMPAKAKKPGDNGKNGLLYKDKAIGRHGKGKRKVL